VKVIKSITLQVKSDDKNTKPPRRQDRQEFASGQLPVCAPEKIQPTA